MKSNLNAALNLTVAVSYTPGTCGLESGNIPSLKQE